MAKFTFVGDPAEGKKQSSQECVFVHRDTGEQVKFVLGEATETPEWLAARLKNSTHFKAVEETKKHDHSRDKS
jgi:hypothetical protein